MSIIEVREVNKSFTNGSETTKVLKNINLCIEEGEFASIMGPSGGGKSTLLYLLGGLDIPTSGSVWVNGNDLNKLNDKQLCEMRSQDVGFVFQFYNLVPNLNVEDNIMLPLMVGGKKISNYKDRIDECLHLIGMENKRKLTPRELSGGQQQRVAIVRAMCCDAQLVIADEPPGNLDEKNSADIIRIFKQLAHEQNKCVIVITHEKEIANECDTVLRLQNKRFNIEK